MHDQYQSDSPAEPEQKLDGRRNNRAPLEHQIKPGEVRNPHGRRGKKSKAAAAPLSSIDAYVLAEGSRIVSNGPDGPVDAFRRLVQEDFRDALVDGDQKVRARLLANARLASDRQDVMLHELMEMAFNYKANTSEEFRRREAMRHPPPDLTPHPEHVNIRDGRVWFSGPTDHEGRKAWETIKAAIKVAAFFQDRYRKAARDTPSDYLLEQLAIYTKRRRWLMRYVPKGWSWRERIWCLDSMQEVVDLVLNHFKDLSIEDEQIAIED